MRKKTNNEEREEGKIEGNMEKKGEAEEKRTKGRKMKLRLRMIMQKLVESRQAERSKS